MTDFKPEELLAATLADQISTAGHVAVGAASPIPAAAALLHQMRSPRRIHVTILHSRRHNSFTDGGRELFDCAAQGRIDVFFLGGVQIDGEANINLVGPGEYPATTQRFPGNFGSPYMSFVVPNIVLFREEHSPRTLVPRVDYVSAPGWSPEGTWRRGGPKVLVTGLAVMPFDAARRRFRLASVHPGRSAGEVKAATGFDFDMEAEVPVTAAPDAETLGLLRGPIAAKLREFYPDFADRVFPLPA